MVAARRAEIAEGPSCTAAAVVVQAAGKTAVQPADIVRVAAGQVVRRTAGIDLLAEGSLAESFAGFRIVDPTRRSAVVCTSLWGTGLELERRL